MRTRRKSGCLFVRPACRAAIVFALISMSLASVLPDAYASDRPAGRVQEKDDQEPSEVAIILQLAIGKSRHQLRRSRAQCDRHASGVLLRRTADMLALAECFTSGQGRPKSLLQAQKVLILAAAQGSADAHLALGQFFRDGRIVRKDLHQAAEHFRIGAEAGIPMAMVEYGLVLLRLSADRDSACDWFSRAADLDAREGIRLLGDCFAWGVGARRADARAVELYQQAARLGDRTAALKLAGHEFKGAAARLAAQEGCDWASRAALRYNQLASRAHAYCLSVRP